MKPGYKQTDVGVFPEEWEVKTMGSLTSLMTNGFVGTATSAYVDSDDGALYIQGYNVQENGFNFHGIKRVSKSFHARNQKSCLQPGDLLTIQTGDIGVTTVVPPELAGANCHALVISRLNKRVSEPRFYCQYLNSERGRAQFKEIETGSTMKHLNVGDMKLLFLPSPPVEEQRAIAEALSGVDALLGALDRLIAKKRDLKQAAMQQLLTGRTRLPGFHSEWEVKRIAEVASPTSDKNVRGEILPVLTCSKHLGFMDSLGFFKNQVFSKDLSTYKVIRRGQIGYPANHIEEGSIGLQDLYEVALVSPIYVIFSVGEGVNSFFLHRLLKLDSFRRKFSTATTSSVDRRGSLRWPAFSGIAVSLPTLPEQTAIAGVLTDMDAELVVLEQRREKTRALKQAMMQELLTGRTRLV